MGARVWVGTSGFSYSHWRGVFYPEDLSSSGWLKFYAGRFNTVELNNTYYRLPSEKTAAGWRDSAPDGFLFAVKMSRFITHFRRLKDAEGPLVNFIDRVRILGEKLGPLLYQLPEQMPRDDERLESFLEILPRELKHAFEFRHPSWLDGAVFEIMKRHNAGFCIFDKPGLTAPVIATADFAYVRLHGSEGLYSSLYSDEQLKEWAEKLVELGKNLKELYVYFNNDMGGFAVRNAGTLLKIFENLHA